VLRRDGRLGARPDAQLPVQKASAAPALPPIGEALQLLAKCANSLLSLSLELFHALRSRLTHLVQPNPHEQLALPRPHSILCSASNRLGCASWCVQY